MFIFFLFVENKNKFCVWQKTATFNFPPQEKYSVYDGGVRTVATIWSPLLKKSQVINNLMHITDWLPTLYFIAGKD